MTKVHYFLEGRYAASTDIPPSVYFGVRSHVYICSTCGKEWARVVSEPPSYWDAHSKPCRHHRPVGAWDWSAVPGTLTCSLTRNGPVWDRGLDLEYLPLAVLKWEFLREFENFERLQNGE